MWLWIFSISLKINTSIILRQNYNGISSLEVTRIPSFSAKVQKLKKGKPQELVLGIPQKVVDHELKMPRVNNLTKSFHCKDERSLQKRSCSTIDLQLTDLSHTTKLPALQ
ncbi:hypothetical protein Ancab_032048, partial [Ancistrocladus abbreviatus]